MMNEYTKETAHVEINRIFCDLFPKKGLAQRDDQVKLSHMMFDAMLEHRIALCDAGTGIGKTYAYLLARDWAVLTVVRSACRPAAAVTSRCAATSIF